MKQTRWLIWLALGAAAVAAFSARRLAHGTVDSATTGHLGRVPAFSLRDQTGSPVSAEDYVGKVWVASFIFTRCQAVCPLLTAKLAALVARTSSSDLRFVSISVDPEHDTPHVLAGYAARFGAHPSRWRFLTGPLADIERTMVRGFKMHLGERVPSAHDPSLVEIMHGEHFVLVDARGEIRGYFSADAQGLQALEGAAETLLRSP